MKKLNLNTRLLIVFLVFIAGLMLTEFAFTDSNERQYERQMRQAVELTKKWFKIIKEQKELREIKSDANSNVANNFLIGDDFTTITTTLGSLSAKEISTNPDFAALLIRLIKEAKISNDSKVGVIASGSFPALTISTLAALQTLKMDIVFLSSLGASTFGANQTDATWVDIENWLIEKGNLKYKSDLISRGAENDNGSGLLEEGIYQMDLAAERNNRTLYLPDSLMQSITERTAIFKANTISLLINIGGNQAAIGRCSHTVSIPNGLNSHIELCDDTERGVIQELNESGIPIINLLNIKDLANKYGIDISPGIHYSESQKLFKETLKNKFILAITLLVGLIPFYFLRKTD